MKENTPIFENLNEKAVEAELTEEPKTSAEPLNEKVHDRMIEVVTSLEDAVREITAMNEKQAEALEMLKTLPTGKSEAIDLLVENFGNGIKESESDIETYNARVKLYRNYIEHSQDERLMLAVLGFMGAENPVEVLKFIEQ